MGLISGFIGGLAQGGLDAVGRQQDIAAKRDQAQFESDLATKRQEALLVLQDRYAKSQATFSNEMKNKPLNDYAAAVAAHQGDTVPNDSIAPVTQTSGIVDRSTMLGVDGQPIQSFGNGDVGLAGNVAKLRAQIINSTTMSDEDKQGALSQLDAQIAQANQVKAAMTPPTRTVTATEAADLGMQDLLKAGNGAAYAAGRPLLLDKTMTVPDGAAIIDPRSGKLLFQNSGKADRQLEHEGAQTKLQQDRLDAQERMKNKELDPLGINSAANGDTVGAPGTVAQAIASGVTGNDFLNTLPKAQGEMVKALAEGRMSFPAGFALKSPYWQGMMTLVGQYDPTFDTINTGTRAATRKDFTSGKSAQSANALNTVLGHLDSLGEAADALNNTSVPIWNSLANSVASGTGDPRVKKFNATKKAVVDELTRAWRGSGGSEGDIKTWSTTLDAADSPEQLHGVIGQLGELLESKIGSLNDQYTKGMGIAANGLNLMSPHASKVLQKIKQRAGMDSSGSQDTQQSGVLTYDPATGTFH